MCHIGCVRFAGYCGQMYRRHLFSYGGLLCCSYLQKYSKEVQEVKQKNQEEIRKLRQQCEDKDDKIKTLNHKLMQDAQEK